MTHEYQSLFYRYQREGSLRSAMQVLPLLVSALSSKSVLDVGCGAGAWLAAYRALGIDDVLGVDGAYVDRSLLMVDESMFVDMDITRPFDLGRSFDLVQCLEVAEHVHRSMSDVLIDNLVRHAPMVLFSAAVPGQGGEHHINEQPYEFWRHRFAERGYRFHDFLRPRLVDHASVEPWYRYNLMLFVQDAACAALPDAVAATRVDDAEPVRDVSPLAYRARKAALRLVPRTIVTALAGQKHRHSVRRAARRS